MKLLNLINIYYLLTLRCTARVYEKQNIVYALEKIKLAGKKCYLL